MELHLAGFHCCLLGNSRQKWKSAMSSPCSSCCCCYHSSVQCIFFFGLTHALAGCWRLFIPKKKKKGNQIIGQNSRLSKMTVSPFIIHLLSAYISLPSDHHVPLQSETAPANQWSKTVMRRIIIKFLYLQKQGSPSTYRWLLIHHKTYNHAV